MLPRIQLFWKIRALELGLEPSPGPSKASCPPGTGLARVGEQGPAQLSPHPILPWQVDSQGFRVWGVERGCRLELSEFIHQVAPNLPPEVLGSLPSPHHWLLTPSLLVKAACPITPHKEGRGPFLHRLQG